MRVLALVSSPCLMMRSWPDALLNCFLDCPALWMTSIESALGNWEMEDCSTATSIWSNTCLLISSAWWCHGLGITINPRNMESLYKRLCTVYCTHPAWLHQKSRVYLKWLVPKRVGLNFLGKNDMGESYIWLYIAFNSNPEPACSIVKDADKENAIQMCTCLWKGPTCRVLPSTDYLTHKPFTTNSYLHSAKLSHRLPLQSLFGALERCLRVLTYMESSTKCFDHISHKYSLLSIRGQSSLSLLYCNHAW